MKFHDNDLGGGQMRKIFSAFTLLFLMAAPAWAVTPATGPTKVCMVGDSITARGVYWRSYMADTRGAEWSYIGNFTDDGGYRHDGVGGNTSRDVLNRVQTIQGCDIVLLLIGGNDLMSWVPASTIVANIQMIADTLSATGATVYIQTVLPANIKKYRVEANLLIANLNSRIKTQIIGYTILDTWSAFTQSGKDPELLFLEDGIHLTRIGYSVLANYVRSAVP